MLTLFEGKQMKRLSTTNCKELVDFVEWWKNENGILLLPCQFIRNVESNYFADFFGEYYPLVSQEILKKYNEVKK